MLHAARPFVSLFSFSFPKFIVVLFLLVAR